MMRRIQRILLLLAGSCALMGAALIVEASSADAAERCGPDALGPIAFSVNGQDPVGDLAEVEPLVAGDDVVMSWGGASNSCDDELVTLAAHRVDASPTAEVTVAEACVIAECGGSISLVVPDRTVVCLGDLVAATGSPQLHRNFYADREISAGRIDAGDCTGPTPFASVVVLCTQRSVGVSLTNIGDLDAVITIRIDGEVARSVEVGSRERFETFPVVEDRPISITVFAADQLVLERNLVPDCWPDPDVPTISPDCAAGGASVVLDNPTPDPIDYVVLVDGMPSDVAVGAFRIEKVTVRLGEDTTSVVRVLGSDAGELVRAVVRSDCEQPRATVALDCATDSVAFTLANDGPSATLIDLLLDGSVMVSIPVGGGDEVVARLDLIEDRGVDAAAMSGGVELVAQRLAVDCDPPASPPPTAPPVAAPTGQVLGVVFARTGSSPTSDAGTLPTTGSETLGLVLAAALLLALGGGFATYAKICEGKTHNT